MHLVSRIPPGGGARAPVLFVHGAWHSAWCWEQHFLPYFAERGRAAYAFSLRGHGGEPNAKPLWRTRLRDYVDDVARAVEKVPSPPVIVGHSMGGMIVQHHLLRRDDAPAAVLLAPVPPGGALGASLRVGARHPAAFARTLLSGHLEPIVDDPARARSLLASDRIPPDEWAKIQPTLQDEAYLAYWDMVLFDLPKPRRLRTPLLVLGAGDDRLFTHAEVHQTAEAYGARMEILPDLSHDVMLDPNWRTAADRILAWLNERGV